MVSDELELAPDFGFENPFIVSSITVNTSHEYMAQRDIIHTYLSSLGVDNDELEMLDEALGPMGDTDSAEGLISYMEMYLDGQPIVDLTTLARNLGDELPEIEIVAPIPENLENGLETLLAEFSLDAMAEPSKSDGLKVKNYEPEVEPTVFPNNGVMPPRPPPIMDNEGQCTAIVLLRSRSPRQYRLRSHLKWGDIISKYMPENTSLGPEDHFSWDMRRRESDAAFDIESQSSLASLASMIEAEGRSNTRPAGGIVMVRMEDGSMHNIGAHSYKLREDILIPLVLDGVHDALSELFAAEAGEGTACATGSHVLHQVMSAVITNAIEDAQGSFSVECEQEGADFIVKDSRYKLLFDITSTAGIWHKPLRRRQMCAISKYDLAACVLSSMSGLHAETIALSIACCLAVEHPAYYGIPDLKGLPQDLQIQYRISDVLNRMSQKSLKTLCKMSYEAVLCESVSEAVGIDPWAEGRTYSDKAKVLIDAIQSIKHQDRVAVPPIPVSEIRGFHSKHQHVRLLTDELIFPSAALASTFEGGIFKPYDQDSLMQSFPACGLFPFQEAWDWCSELQGQFMGSTGSVHRGPVTKTDDEMPDTEIWEATCEVYASSAIAQFAEIRADVVRLIDKTAATGHGRWRTGIVYQGKVCVWLRIRDSVVDARGYRIDWFAMSTFRTVGSVNISDNAEYPVYLWPRQRIRSQEMELASMAPRRLKLTLYSMFTKARTTKAKYGEIIQAWQKLALTAVSSTWASGANYITCRHLSASLCSPSPPFDSMAKKFRPIKTLAGVLYFASLDKALKEWDHRDKYHNRAAILGLPRAYAQLEAYWQVWTPDEFADSRKNFTDCILGLYGEYVDQDATASIRCEDLANQLSLIQGSEIHFQDIRKSVRASCTLKTGGKFGWSVFGSLASGYALSLQGSPSDFDRSFSRGEKARTLVDHLTVRHSARIDERKKLESGTVAELILKQGVDDYLSTLKPSVRFYYGSVPYFFNHPKKNERKEREISITDPDSRIMLNDAEHICGEYGRNTSIDMLKRPDKDAHFYKISAEAVLKGGVIQASDASRFAAMMSNIAVSITILALGTLGGSAHLLSASVTYRRMAFRRMIIHTEVLDELDKRLEQERPAEELEILAKAHKWVRRMPKMGTDGLHDLRYYTTACHTGQGMSHVGMSLEHGGALLISIRAAEMAQIYVSGKQAIVLGSPLVTSDDSTIIAEIDESKNVTVLSRSERQRACQLFLRVQRKTRDIALRSVSVMQNQSKEKSSGIAGEFNSQDNGIGVACPLLGFREMICQLTRPSAPSLINDYLNAHAYGRTVAFSAQGVNVGCYGHKMYLDALEARWKLLPTERSFLESHPLIPNSLIFGCSPRDMLRTSASMLSSIDRQSLMQLAYVHHTDRPDIALESRDMPFTILSHVSVGMRNQHKHALKVLVAKVEDLKKKGMVHQAMRLEMSLRATMSSAKTRGAGRIAQRIRNRMVKPDDCVGHTFQKGPLLETTLQWLDYIGSHIKTVSAEPDIKNLATVYGSILRVNGLTYSRFPEPATKRRSKSSRAKKPRFVLSSYGLTPFGRHSVLRSKATVVEKVGLEERKQFTLYQASKSYRQIPEHMQYGGKFVVSWHAQTAGTIVSESPSPMPITVAPTEEYWGKMDEESIEYLKDMEQKYEGIPVLSLNYGIGNRAYFHCVHRGTPYSVSTECDFQASPTKTCLPALASGAVPVMIANQGWTSERRWYGNGPSGLEIESFQFGTEEVFSNIDVESTWTKLETQGMTTVPLAAALRESEAGDELYMIAPKMTRSCNKSLYPYHRARFIANLATGGYWYTALRGVCVRAFLKGHSGSRNSWTGPVLGWRASRSQDPDYTWKPPEHGIIKSLAMVGGIDNDDQIANLNPVEFASGNCYVDREGMHLVAESHTVEYSKENLSLIMKMNGGNLLFNASQGKAQLIDSALPAIRDVSSALSVEECGHRLWGIVHGAGEDIDDLLM